MRPPSHGVHSDEPGGEISLPAHSPSHSICSSPLNLPGSHAMHTLLSGCDACLPPRHLVQPACPGTATQPGLQLAQVGLPAVAEVPLGQILHRV